MRARVHRKMAINSRGTWPLLFRSGGWGSNPTNKELPLVFPYPSPSVPAKSTQKALKQIVCALWCQPWKRCCPLIPWQETLEEEEGGEGRGGSLNGAEIRQSEVNKWIMRILSIYLEKEWILKYCKRWQPWEEHMALIAKLMNYGEKLKYLSY